MKAYLDHNAAAPLTPAAQAAMQAAMGACGNPSSVHGAGRAARRIVEDARAAVAWAVGAAAADVVFTGSGTEACQLMLRLPARPRVLAAATEHAAVLAAAPDATLLPVEPDGVLDLAALESALAAGGSDAVVAVMLANNETGTVQPIAEIAEIAHAADALLAVDAAQALGKLPIRMNELQSDALALSAAKIGGPLGVGAAVFRPGLAPRPLVSGGGQERGLRGGSENVVGIAGFGAAAGALDTSIAAQGELSLIRDWIEASISEICPQSIPRPPVRLGNTTALTMPGVPAATQVMSLDLAGYAVSAGAACSSGKVAQSHVLRAMGCPDDVAGETIRVSLGPGVDRAAAEGFVQAWRALYSRASRPATERRHG